MTEIAAWDRAASGKRKRQKKGGADGIYQYQGLKYRYKQRHYSCLQNIEAENYISQLSYSDGRSRTNATIRNRCS